MLFNSIVFLFLFLPVAVAVYYFLISKRIIEGAKIWLITASLYFYAYWNIKYLPLILISMAFNYTLGTLIACPPPQAQPSCRIKRKSLLIFGIIANLSALAYFKYADFLIDNYNRFADTTYPHLNIVLPLAISFFTFQQIAYLVDSYKGLTQEHDPLTYMLFVVFFPQLIAGPIVAHYEMMPQFNKVKNLAKNYHHIFQGSVIFLIGLFKKIVIADTFAKYATIGFDQLDKLNLITGWFTSLSYTAQIYFDFSGYCDMAIGCALFFNIKLPINFNSPYKALNIQDFWKRWHITLSRFLRDYLYIPLGGNQKGTFRTYINIAAVFLIGGLWHGAAWTFVIWGAIHGLGNIIYRLWKTTGFHLHKALAWIITFNFINIAWIFFRAKSFDSAKKVLYAMFDISSLSDFPELRAKYYFQDFSRHSTMIYILGLLLVLCISMPNSTQISTFAAVRSKKQTYYWSLALLVASLGLAAKIIIIPYTEFIYFNF